MWLLVMYAQGKAVYWYELSWHAVQEVLSMTEIHEDLDYYPLFDGDG